MEELASMVVIWRRAGDDGTKDAGGNGGSAAQMLEVLVVLVVMVPIKLILLQHKVVKVLVVDQDMIHLQLGQLAEEMGLV